MQITLTHGSAQDRQIAENFMVAFFMDLARYDENIHINAYGLPVYVPPDEVPPDKVPPDDGIAGKSPGAWVRTWADCRRANWWIRDKCTLYVIRVDDVPAGYAAVLAEPDYLPDSDLDFELLDFYIMPKFRGQGIGRAAARAVFDRHRGRWVVFELETNAPARAFWQAVLHDYTQGQFENRQGGTEQRFRN